MAPDVVADAVATWERSRPVLPELRRRGWPAGYVAQDGMELLQPDWTAFDALFIGGSTAWKLSDHAAKLAGQAKAQGQHVHMGRVNSARRLQIAASFGCDSVDGTYVAFAPHKNGPKVLGWLSGLHPTLPF